MTDYFVLVKPWATYVKEAAFFRQQNGHREAWGEKWILVSAESIEAARALGPKLSHDECNCGCRCGSCDSSAPHDDGCPGPYVHRGIASEDAKSCDATKCWCHRVRAMLDGGASRG